MRKGEGMFKRNSKKNILSYLTKDIKNILKTFKEITTVLLLFFGCSAIARVGGIKFLLILVILSLIISVLIYLSILFERILIQRKSSNKK